MATKKPTSSKPPDKPTDALVEQGEKIVKNKPRGGNSPIIGDNGISTKPGDNAKYAGILLEVASWPPVDKADVKQLEERFVKYVKYCAENDIKVGNQMCYLAMGITKDDAFHWANGLTRGDAHGDFIKKVQSFCAGNRELLMQDGKVNPITGIFWQKNYDGMKDQQEYILTPNSPLGPDGDPATLTGKYNTALPPATIEQE
jgi:hypothetical protein